MRFLSTLTARLAAVSMACAVLLTACGGDTTGLANTSVTRIVIAPDTLSLDPQQRVTFLAYGETPERDSVPVSVSWSANGGAITSNGVYTATTDTGYYDVVATDTRGHKGIASVHTTRLLKQVVLMPAVASVMIGSAFQFRSYGLNRFGDSTATPVRYTTTTGTIAATGLLTAGSTPGTYQVIVIGINGMADTSSVTVTTTPPPPPAGVSTVEVTPGSATMDPGTTFKLRATARDASGNELTGKTFSWTSSSTATATVDGTGLVRAMSSGAVTISVTTGGKTGTAQVSIAVPPVATVSVSPSTVSLNQGATQALSAALRDASGNTINGRSIIWTSSNMSVATVNASGTVSAVAGGNATITATSEGKSGSAAVTVAAPSIVSECSAPKAQWIWCDDFEQDRLSRYFEMDNAGGNFARTPGVGYNGSSAMRAHWNAGSQNAGALHVAIGKTPSSYFRAVDAGTANYREVYWRLYVKNQAGWVGGGADKLTRAMVFAGGNFSQAAIGHVWSGTGGTASNYLMVDPASGTDAVGNVLTTGYNDFTHLSWLGSVQAGTPTFDAAHVGQWHCIEAHMKLNTAGSSNGVLEMWVNGTLQAQRTGLNFVGSFTQYGINAIYLENYWNAGSSATQERYLDNVVVSTARVGC